MKIHIVTNLFAPDELAGASLFTDLALFLKERGHDVRVTTTFSYYPAWSLRESDRGVAWRDEIYRGIPVRRAAMRVPAKLTGAGRLLADASFLAAILRYGHFKGWLPEVVLTASPMFSQCLAQRFFYAGKRIPRLIVVQDFVVDAALELGIVRFPGFRTFFLRLEKWAFESASTLLTISPAMLEKLQAKVSGKRLLYVPNWIHRSIEEEAARQRVGVIPRVPSRLLYAGNLGRKQGLPDFLKTFAKASEGWNLHIHGGGAEAAELTESARRLENVQIGGVLEETAYMRALLETTACLVTQRPGVGANFLPSKLLPALATATPVLAVCEADSPLGREVREGGFGEVIPPEDAVALRTVLRRWKDNPSETVRFSAKAAERAGLYRREKILGIYEAELLRLGCASES